jgi:primosomal protein N' (replication factor Y)
MEKIGHNFRHTPASSPEKLYAQVAINVPLNKTFHYKVPEELEGRLRVGARVIVPFGRRHTTGYCVGLSGECPLEDHLVRNVVEVVDEVPLLDSPMLALTQWVAQEYQCSWGAALEAALPAAVREGRAGRKVTLVEARRPASEMLDQAAVIEMRAPRQAAALRALAEAGELTLAELAGTTGADSSVVHALARRGWVQVRKESLPTDALAGLRAPRTAPYVPTPDQKTALEEIFQRLASERPGVVLLHGVTGSGKTEVYLQALRKVVDEGKQGIVLVPEISLTPQTVRRFASRFEKVAVLHSRLTEAERRDEWRRIRSGGVEVVIGVRSAIFAPTSKLGLVVVDEEHEPSFKQQASPRYHAVSVAIRRAEQEGALVILGSATPSLETYCRARTGGYAHVLLPRRVTQSPLPRVEIVDMKVERAEQKKFCLLSRRLTAAMRQSLSQGDQVILFLNRRGFSTFITCARCRYVLKCERCDVSLVYHRKSGRAKCHYCGLEREAPLECPACGSPALRYLGVGTQRIEEELRALFPQHTCARMDSDSTRARRSHREILDDFREGRTHVLLGTQMIAKGLDFPNVTLVGVLDADVALNLPDFRSSERTFQLIAQVAGRTGRGFKGGRVIVQTSSPEQACVRFAIHHDHAGFAEHELANRRALGYPPFGRLTRILVEAKDADRCRSKCQEIAAMLQTVRGDKNVEILGPAEAPIARMKGAYRWHLILKELTPGHMHELLAACRSSLRSSGGAQVTIDVDPINML